MKLKVIAGAKEGVEVPLKKSKFVIGRSADCTLRAGSDAISRHHCVLLRKESGDITVRDLGSRNGTLVNKVKIDGETPLNNGDELQVGPLRFLAVFEADLKREKKPAVKSIAEAVERASQEDSVAADDDISRWLLGPEVAGSNENTVLPSLQETQSLKMDETQTIKRPEPQQAEAGSETIGTETAIPEGDDEEDKPAAKKGRQKPGKLPPLPNKPQAKDSREAAADILREMARRR